MLRSHQAFQRWEKDQSTLELTETTLDRKANGSTSAPTLDALIQATTNAPRFRLVAPHIEELKVSWTKAEVQDALENLPRELNETYRRILAAIPQNRHENAIRLLQLLLWLPVPATVDEAAVTLVVQTDKEPYFNHDKRLADVLELAFASRTTEPFVHGRIEYASGDLMNWRFPAETLPQGH